MSTDELREAMTSIQDPLQVGDSCFSSHFLAEKDRVTWWMLLLSWVEGYSVKSKRGRQKISHKLSIFMISYDDLLRSLMSQTVVKCHTLLWRLSQIVATICFCSPLPAVPNWLSSRYEGFCPQVAFLHWGCIFGQAHACSDATVLCASSSQSLGSFFPWWLRIPPSSALEKAQLEQPAQEACDRLHRRSWPWDAKNYPDPSPPPISRVEEDNFGLQDPKRAQMPAKQGGKTSKTTNGPYHRVWPQIRQKNARKQGEKPKGQMVPSSRGHTPHLNPWLALSHFSLSLLNTKNHRRTSGSHSF